MRSLVITLVVFECCALLAAVTGNAGDPSSRNRTDIDVQIEHTTTGTILLSWNTLAGATGYKIYHSAVPLPIPDPGWALLAELAGTSYETAASVGEQFYYAQGVFIPGNFVYVEGSTVTWLPRYPYAVTIESFIIDKYEVTRSGYSSIMGTGETGNIPIMRIGWYDMIEYCNLRSMAEGITPCYSYVVSGTDYGTNPAAWPAAWNSDSNNHTNIQCNFSSVGYRLLRETEWEYAAMGGIYTHLYTYSGSNTCGDVAWYSANSGSHGHDVGTKAPNELGIYDMSGNADEFLWDYSGINRIRKGGSWFFSTSYCEIYWRAWSNAVSGGGLIMCGFRVCRSLP